MFGVAQNVQEVVVDPGFLLFAMAMGTGTSIVAALVPARNAARVEPIQALQKGRYQVLGAGENRLRRNIALLAAALAVACLPLSGWRPAFFAGILLTLVAGLLLTPFLSLELARLLRRPMKWLRPVEGALAADSLIQAPRRTSATVAALMLSLALVIGQGGVARAQPAIHRRMDEQHAESRHVRLHHREHRIARCALSGQHATGVGKCSRRRGDPAGAHCRGCSFTATR